MTTRGARVQRVDAALPPQVEERWDELYWEPLRRRLRVASV